MHRKVLSLSNHAIVIFKQLFFLKAHFPADVFHEIRGITDSLKKNAHNQNEQTKLIMAHSIALTLRIPRGSSGSSKGFSQITFDWHKL